jgi:hypothetical protein
MLIKLQNFVSPDQFVYVNPDNIVEVDPIGGSGPFYSNVRFVGWNGDQGTPIHFTTPVVETPDDIAALVNALAQPVTVSATISESSTATISPP